MTTRQKTIRPVPLLTGLADEMEALDEEFADHHASLVFTGQTGSVWLGGDVKFVCFEPGWPVDDLAATYVVGDLDKLRSGDAGGMEFVGAEVVDGMLLFGERGLDGGDFIGRIGVGGHGW